MAIRSWFLGFTLLALVVVAAASGAEEEEEIEQVNEEFVVILDHSNFTDFIEKQDFVLVEFYAPWCGACKSLTPKYAKAAAELQNHDPPIVLAKFDAVDESNKEIAAKYGVKKFPTLKIFTRGGRITLDFKGSRADSDGIVSYLKKHRGPASTEIGSLDEATSLIDANKIVVVGVFPDFSGEEFTNFVILAEHLRIDYEFAHTSDAKHLPRGDSSATGPFVRLFKPFDGLFSDTKDFEVTALFNFVEESSTPIVTVFDKDPANSVFITKYVARPDSKVMMFANFTDDLTDAIKAKYLEVAQQLKGEPLAFLFGDSDVAEGVFRAFGLKNEQLPLVIVQATTGDKYLKTNLKPEDIAPWLKDLKEGKLPIYLKSEPIPEPNDEPLKTVVGKNLEEVFNSGKNVLVVFHIPWDVNYEKFEPTLKEIATEYQNVPDVVISKFHESANDYNTEMYKHDEIPTLFFKRASGQMSKYEGKLTKEGVIDFIESTRDKVAEPEQVAEKAAAAQETGKDEL